MNNQNSLNVIIFLEHLVMFLYKIDQGGIHYQSIFIKFLKKNSPH